MSIHKVASARFFLCIGRINARMAGVLREESSQYVAGSMLMPIVNFYLLKTVSYITNCNQL